MAGHIIHLEVPRVPWNSSVAHVLSYLFLEFLDLSIQKYSGCPRVPQNSSCAYGWSYYPFKSAWSTPEFIGGPCFIMPGSRISQLKLISEVLVF